MATSGQDEKWMRSAEAQRGMHGRQGRIRMREEQALKQGTGIDSRAEKLDKHRARMAFESQALARCCQELGVWLKREQHEPIERTRRSLGTGCTIEEEVAERARTTMQKAGTEVWEALAFDPAAATIHPAAALRIPRDRWEERGRG